MRWIRQRVPTFTHPLQSIWRKSVRVFSLLFVLSLGLSLMVSACSSAEPSGNSTHSAASPANSAQVLRIGYQKSSTALNLLKSQQSLEKRLQPEGVAVEWNEFAAGPQMLEALNVGSIDFAYTGETPPVFAQAAGAPLNYVAYEPLGGSAEAILVPKDSPIQTVADLKGKTVTLNKGSNVHYLLVKALAEAGLEYGDIQTAFLPPSDARAAFEQGNVDAWVIWDPFQAAAEQSIGARVLRDGKGLVENRGFFLSTQAFTQSSPDLIKTLLDELTQVSEWAKNHPKEVVDFLSSELGIDKAALELAEQRRNYGILPLSDDVVTGQQQIADTFHKLGLIPKEIKISEVIWQG